MTINPNRPSQIVVINVCIQSSMEIFRSPVILVPYVKVRTETSPEDVGGMHAAEGILTARGGMTSHAAVVARGWGKCCVSGCSDVHVNDAAKVSHVSKMVNEVYQYP